MACFVKSKEVTKFPKFLLRENSTSSRYWIVKDKMPAICYQLDLVLMMQHLKCVSNKCRSIEIILIRVIFEGGPMPKGGTPSLKRLCLKDLQLQIFGPNAPKILKNKGFDEIIGLHGLKMQNLAGSREMYWYCTNFDTKVMISSILKKMRKFWKYWGFFRKQFFGPKTPNF